MIDIADCRNVRTQTAAMTRIIRGHIEMAGEISLITQISTAFGSGCIRGIRQ